jgi:hypothetical protein
VVILFLHQLQQSTAAGDSGPFLPLTVGEKDFARHYGLPGVLVRMMCKVPLIGIITRDGP